MQWINSEKIINKTKKNFKLSSQADRNRRELKINIERNYKKKKKIGDVRKYNFF